MSLKVRRAEKKDIPQLLKLLVQVNMVHHVGRPDLFNAVTKYSEKDLEKIIKDDSTPVFVCTDADDIPLGHAFCVLKQAAGEPLFTDIKTLYIDDICVDEASRGMHVGKTLYDHVLGYAKELGCYNVTLNVWSFNTTALKFYESLGMVPQKIGMEKIL